MMDIGSFWGCKFCGGRGCLACPGEADKAYDARFPEGPTPIATFKVDNPDDIKALGEVFHVDAIAEAERDLSADLQGFNPLTLQFPERRPFKTVTDRLVDRLREVRPECLGDGTKGDA